MTPFSIPSGQIEDRLSKLQKEIRVNRLDGVLIVQRVDLIYFAARYDHRPGA